MDQGTIARACRQTVSYEPSTGLSDRNEHTYGAATSVAARKVSQSKDMVTKDGEVTTASCRFTLLFAPAIGDRLDGSEVIRVDAMTDYLGNNVGWQAYTR